MHTQCTHPARTPRRTPRTHPARTPRTHTARTRPARTPRTHTPRAHPARTLCTAAAALHGVNIKSKTLRKRLFTGQQGPHGFLSLMQQSRPYYRGGREEVVSTVLEACFGLLAMSDYGE